MWVARYRLHVCPKSASIVPAAHVSTIRPPLWARPHVTVDPARIGYSFVLWGSWQHGRQTAKRLEFHSDGHALCGDINFMSAHSQKLRLIEVTVLHQVENYLVLNKYHQYSCGLTVQSRAIFDRSPSATCNAWVSLHCRNGTWDALREPRATMTLSSSDSCRATEAKGEHAILWIKF